MKGQTAAFCFCSDCKIDVFGIVECTFHTSELTRYFNRIASEEFNVLKLCNAVPSKQDLVYVRVAENASLQPGALICKVTVEIAPGKLQVLPSNQIYSFGEGSTVNQNRALANSTPPRNPSQETNGVRYERESDSSSHAKASSLRCICWQLFPKLINQRIFRSAVELDCHVKSMTSISNACYVQIAVFVKVFVAKHESMSPQRLLHLS